MRAKDLFAFYRRAFKSLLSDPRENSRLCSGVGCRLGASIDRLRQMDSSMRVYERKLERLSSVGQRVPPHVRTGIAWLELSYKYTNS